MERLDENNIWSNPNEIQLDDNVEPENNPDEIALDDDDDEMEIPCCAKVEAKPEVAATGSVPKPEIVPKPEPEEENSSDEDGAPQSRPFRLPFLPPPTKTEPEKPEVAKPEVSQPVKVPEKVQNTESKIPPENGNGHVTEKQNKPQNKFKRRNQAIYQEEDD